MLTQLSTIKSRLHPRGRHHKRCSANECHQSALRPLRQRNKSHPGPHRLRYAGVPRRRLRNPPRWQEKTGTDYVIRSGCIISLLSPLFYFPSSTSPALARVTYTGGYLLPGSPPPDPPVAACQGLPDDLEQACVEQVAYWFQNREHLGLKTYWPRRRCLLPVRCPRSPRLRESHPQPLPPIHFLARRSEPYFSPSD